MTARMDTRPMQDQEDRANIAVGAMVALQDLLSNQHTNASVPAEPLAHLLELVINAARDAIPNGWPKHGKAVNDEDD